MTALPGPYVRAKFHWLRGETGAAAPFIDALAGGRGDSHALWLPADALEASADSSFENLLAGLLADDAHLLVPYGDAVERLWEAFPGQVVIHVLEQRAQATTPETGLLDAAARAGVLSLDPADYDRVGRVSFHEGGSPALAAHADVARLRELIDEAERRDAWQAFAATHAEPLTDVFLDAVFHRSRPFYPEMALDALGRIARDEPAVLDLAGATLAGRDGPEAEAIVVVGMRLEDGSPDCLDTLLDAIPEREFEEFGSDCLLD